MLRVTTEPEDSELVELMKSDSLGRNKDLGNLIRLFDASEEGLSIFLDGSWGCGKSYFVRQAELLLKGLNSAIRTPTGITSEIVNGVLSAAQYNREKKRTYLPVYFNSWRHDAYGEPVLSLMSDIADLEEIETGREWDEQEVKSLLVAIAKCLFRAVVPGGAELLNAGSEVADSALRLRVPEKDPLQEYKDRKDLEKHVGTLVEKARRAAGDAETIVIFVDELDRCRPAYAVEVLESVKHLLVRRDVIVVFSVDASQLAEIIRGLYGDGYDAARYLRRFYDVYLRLPEVTGRGFAEKVLGQQTSFGTISDNVVGELVTLGDLTLRDVAQLYEMYGRVGDASYPPNDDLGLFAILYLRPFVCYLQVVRPIALKDVMGKGVVSGFVTGYANSSKMISSVLDSLRSQNGVWTPSGHETSEVEARKRLFEDLLIVFLATESSPAYAEARSRIHMNDNRISRCRRLVYEVLEIPTAVGV